MGSVKEMNNKKATMIRRIKNLVLCSVLVVVSMLMGCSQHEEFPENLSYAAWHATESFALYHYQSFAQALKKNEKFNEAFALTLKGIAPRSCIVLFSILRMLFKMSMSKKRPGKVKKKSKNWKVKLLSRISKVIVKQNLDIVKKTQWALDFLSGSDQQHALPVVDGLLDFLAEHPYGKWFNLRNDQQ